MASSTPSPDLRQSGRGRQLAVWLFGIGVSTGLLVLLYRIVDVRLVGSTLRDAHPGWLLVSVGFIAPLTALRALRFMWIVPRDARPGFGDAFRMTLVAGTFNMFMPAKTGDLVKSVAIARHQEATGSLGVAAVVYERLADLFALLLWGAAGLLASQAWLTVAPWAWVLVAIMSAACGAIIWSVRPMAVLLAGVSRIRLGGRTPRLVEAVVARTHGWPRLHDDLRGRRGWLMLLSLVIGFLQLSQIWMFAMTVQVVVPFTACVALAAAVLLVGQLPLTFGGMGARDVAFVVLFADRASPEAAAAMGLLSATRGILPALAGLVVMKSHLAAVVDTVRDWQRP